MSPLKSTGIWLEAQSVPGVRGLFDGISGTWMRQMSYSVCRFWAYDESKKLLGAGMCHMSFIRSSSRVYWYKALPLPLGSWHLPGVWVRRNIILLFGSPRN